MPQMTLRELADLIGGELIHADGDGPTVDGIASVEKATSSQVTFVSRRKFLAGAKASDAAAVIIPAKMTVEGKPAITCERIHESIVKALNLFHPPQQFEPGVHETAVVDASASLGEGVHVGPHCVIEAGVKIGPRTVIQGGCHIGPDTVIGEDCHLQPRCVIRHECVIGNRVILQPGAVIGADGFKYEMTDMGMLKIPQVGRVRIEDDVEIGAMAGIDRASMDETVIGQGAKIDNMVQIGHNVEIGPHCVIVAQVGVAGSTKVGMGTVIAGQAGIADNLTIGARCMIGAKSGVASNLEDGSKVLGAPAVNHIEAKRSFTSIQELPNYVKRIRDLEAEVKALKGEE